MTVVPQSTPDQATTPATLIATPLATGAGHYLSQVDDRLADVQACMGELNAKVDMLIRTIESAKLPELAVRVEGLTKTVDGAKLPELSIKIDNLTKTVESAKLSDMSYKIEGLVKAVDGAKLPDMSAKLDATAASVSSIKTKVDDLNHVKAMVIGGFGVLVAMLGFIGWLLKNGLDLYASVQAKPAQVQQGPAPAGAAAPAAPGPMVQPQAAPAWTTNPPQATQPAPKP